MSTSSPSHADTLPDTDALDTLPAEIVLGRGGMGEVVLVRDRTIGRDVALKRLRDGAPTPDAVARFLREATIQARLDHPAIVPVHELGHDAAGRPYFTMKRLAGTTLARRLHAPGPLQPLLRAFVEVCHAVAFAHARGVVHRDLKPANIMLGDYGEVYVLDWGLARVLADAELASGSRDDLPATPGTTQAGELLGTPGYMAPEQVIDARASERPADVYSLGAILRDILATTVVEPPPELAATATRMLEMDAEWRPTAHEVAARVQAFLDGDRDVAARRALAAADLESARREPDRAVAMRAAGRALALDPENREAAELVSRFMLEPPPERPPGLAAELARTEASVMRAHARSSLYGLSGLVLLVPLALWNGVTSWSIFAALAWLMVALHLALRRIRLHPEGSQRLVVAYYAAMVAALPVLERLYGPLVLAAPLACLVVTGALMYPVLTCRAWLVGGAVLAGWLAPVALELAGLLPATWEIRDGTLVIHSAALRITDGVPTYAFLLGGTLLVLVVTIQHVARLAWAHLDARRTLVNQAWHLQQLLPHDTIPR